MMPKTPFGQKWTFFQLANNGYHYPQTVNILRIFAHLSERKMAFCILKYNAMPNIINSTKLTYLLPIIIIYG